MSQAGHSYCSVSSAPLFDHLPARPPPPPFPRSAPAGHLERSEVVSDAVSRHEARTSSGAWLNGPRRDDAVRAVQHRIHAAVGVPEEFGERWVWRGAGAGGQRRAGRAGRQGLSEAHRRHAHAPPFSERLSHAARSLYVLRYAPGQQYAAHTDHCRHEGVGVDAGGNLTKSCRAFLERAGGPGCGPGAGGVSCGDRIATVILYLRWVWK